jgi:hypothetical protein
MEMCSYGSAYKAKRFRTDHKPGQIIPKTKRNFDRWDPIEKEHVLWAFKTMFRPTSNSKNVVKRIIDNKLEIRQVLYRNCTLRQIPNKGKYSSMLFKKLPMGKKFTNLLLQFENSLGLERMQSQGLTEK